MFGLVWLGKKVGLSRPFLCAEVFRCRTDVKHRRPRCTPSEHLVSHIHSMVVTYSARERAYKKMCNNFFIQIQLSTFAI